MKPIDWSKPVVTRDGRKVRVLCTDRKSSQCVVGLVANTVDGSEELHSWHHDGARFIPHLEAPSGPFPTDLINAPERVERWFNLYESEAGCAFPTKADSIEASGLNLPKMLAMVKVTFEDGKPVSVALEDLQ